MLRAVIIDDERSGINALQLLIERNSEQVKIVANATNATQGISIIEDYRPEIVFLDISMPGMNGFDLLKQLKYTDFNLVFTTAHEEYAIQAIKSNAFDYLLKPLDAQEIKNCIARIIEENKKIKNQRKDAFSNTLCLSVKDGVIYILHTDIIRLEASGSYTVFYLENKVKHIGSKGLKEYEAQLDPRIFYRCHNSHLINITKVVRFVSTDGFFAKMTDDSLVEIARKNKEQFLERLKNKTG
ncbi:LytTR family DNA-binding domain-containing protein [soil metagenome]